LQARAATAKGAAASARIKETPKCFIVTTMFVESFETRRDQRMKDREGMLMDIIWTGKFGE
jgi:hypothetical protein